MARWPRKSKIPLEQTVKDNEDGTMSVTWKKAKTVRVRFTPQAWIRDYATEVDPQGPLEFEVPIADAQNEQGQWLPDRSYESDPLQEHKNAPKWIRKWSGPFEIEILHEEIS